MTRCDEFDDCNNDTSSEIGFESTDDTSFHSDTSDLTENMLFESDSLDDYVFFGSQSSNYESIESDNVLSEDVSQGQKYIAWLLAVRFSQKSYKNLLKNGFEKLENT